MGTGLLTVSFTIFTNSGFFSGQILVVLHGPFFHAVGMKIIIVPHNGIDRDLLGTFLFADIAPDTAVESSQMVFEVIQYPGQAVIEYGS